MCLSSTNPSIHFLIRQVPHGQKYDKEYVLKELQTLAAPEPLIPHYVKVESSALCFYVDDIKTAQILLNGDRRITLPDGFKMIIRVRNSIPQVQIDANLKEKMKLAMAKRYTAATKALDLTKFHTDVDLKDIFCALFRPTIMLAAVDIIAENIPDLEALDLSDNKIHLLDHLKCLAKKLPCLKILHMANNKVSFVRFFFFVLLFQSISGACVQQKKNIKFFQDNLSKCIGCTTGMSIGGLSVERKSIKGSTTRRNSVYQVSQF